MKTIIKGKTHQRDELVEWLVNNVGAIVQDEPKHTIGEGWEIQDRVIFYFAKEYDVYIDEPQLALAFALKWV